MSSYTKQRWRKQHCFFWVFAVAALFLAISLLHHIIWQCEPIRLPMFILYVICIYQRRSYVDTGIQLTDKAAILMVKFESWLVPFIFSVVALDAMVCQPLPQKPLTNIRISHAYRCQPKLCSSRTASQLWWSVCASVECFTCIKPQLIAHIHTNTHRRIAKCLCVCSCVYKSRIYTSRHEVCTLHWNYKA